MKILDMLDIKEISFKEIFLKENHNKYIEFLRYFIVGILATVVDCLVIVIIKKITSNLVLGVRLGLLCGFLTTLFVSRKYVFSSKNNLSVIELLVISLITIIGMIFTDIFMKVTSNRYRIHYLILKLIVTIIVMFWNFVSKRIFYKIYNKKDN